MHTWSQAILVYTLKIKCIYFSVVLIEVKRFQQYYASVTKTLNHYTLATVALPAYTVKYMVELLQHTDYINPANNLIHMKSELMSPCTHHI